MHFMFFCQFSSSPTMSVLLQVKKLTEHAIIPQRGSKHAAGYDLSRCAVCMKHFWHAKIWRWEVNQLQPKPSRGQMLCSCSSIISKRGC